MIMPAESNGLMFDEDLKAIDEFFMKKRMEQEQPIEEKPFDPQILDGLITLLTALRKGMGNGLQ